MEFKGNIEVIANNNGTNTSTTFENEQFKISRSSKLAIILLDDINSEFYETVKLWHKIDQDTNTKTYLTINTTPYSAIGKSTQYFVEKVVEESKMIVFNWVDNY